MDTVEASRSMIRRIRYMARFINSYCREEFDDYWRNNFPGNANSQETLDFFSQEGIENMLLLNRVVILGKDSENE